MDAKPRHIMQRLKQQTRNLRREVYAMYLAIHHPQTPWYAKLLAAVIVIYAVSPIDLIPDPIPILGMLDDVIMVPLGVLAVRKLIPARVLAECRQQAAEGVRVKTRWKWMGALVIAALWLACIALLIVWGWRRFGH